MASPAVGRTHGAHPAAWKVNAGARRTCRCRRVASGRRSPLAIRTAGLHAVPSALRDPRRARRANGIRAVARVIAAAYSRAVGRRIGRPRDALLLTSPPQATTQKRATAPNVEPRSMIQSVTEARAARQLQDRSEARTDQHLKRGVTCGRRGGHGFGLQDDSRQSARWGRAHTSALGASSSTRSPPRSPGRPPVAPRDVRRGAIRMSPPASQPWMVRTLFQTSPITLSRSTPWGRTVGPTRRSRRVSPRFKGPSRRTAPMSTTSRTHRTSVPRLESWQCRSAAVRQSPWGVKRTSLSSP